MGLIWRRVVHDRGVPEGSANLELWPLPFPCMKIEFHESLPSLI
jgi:hypothetical protein